MEQCRRTVLLAQLGPPPGHPHSGTQGSERWVSGQGKTRQMQGTRAKVGPGLPVPPAEWLSFSVTPLSLPCPCQMFTSLMGEPPFPPAPVSFPKLQMAQMLSKTRWVPFGPMRSFVNLDLQPPSPLLSPSLQASGCSCFLWPGCSPQTSVRPSSCCARTALRSA